jgi:hypothetical protein
MRIWHWPSGQWNWNVATPASGALYWLAASHDGGTLVSVAMIDTPWSVSANGSNVYVWDGSRWQRRFEVPFIFPGPAVSPDGRYLSVRGTYPPGRRRTNWWDDVCSWLKIRSAPSATNTAMKLFDLSSNAELATIPDAAIAGFAPDGTTLVVGQGENKLHLYDLPLRKPLIKITGLSLLAMLLTFVLPKGVARLRRK